MFLRSCCLGLLAIFSIFGAVNAQGSNCQTFIEANSIPDDSAGVALYSYSYCGGILNLTAYVANIDYDKIVQVYFANGQNESTPLSVIGLGFVEFVPGNDYWQFWSSSTSVYIDGITELINITYAATDINQFYYEILDIPVVATGNPIPPPATPPTPYATPKGLAVDITEYLAPSNNSEASLAKVLLFNNIDVPGAANGTIIAAQSYVSPNYAYNWVRDSSLTMDVVQQLYAAASTSPARNFYANILFQYAQARVTEQNDPDLQTGLGEPKFNLDNTVYTGPWGRPQNDGPATSAITLINFANAYLANNKASLSEIKQLIYDSAEYPTQAPVQRDLLYVASQWSAPCFDIWEEESSYHFYNRLVYHKALLMGAQFANLFDDKNTSATLSSAATAVAATLSEFWDPNRNLILYEYGPVLNGKASYKDAAVILGVLHGYAGDNLYSYSNDQVLATAYELTTSFLSIYPVAKVTTNAHGLPLGIPVGRYPEDVYNGTGTQPSGGNPWFLCTAALAELLYRAAAELQSRGTLSVSSASAPFWAYFAAGAGLTAGRTYTAWEPPFAEAVAALQGWADAFVRRVQFHSSSDAGHLAEEFNRDDGAEQGAPDLTWSYAGLLTAAFARARLAGDEGYVNAVAELGFGFL